MSLSFPPFTAAVKWLVLANAAVFLLMTLLHAADATAFVIVREILALVPQSVVHGWLWQLVTYSFVHEGIFHILFNMLALWMFGAQLEMDWGKKKFYEYYFFCVIGAAITTLAISYSGLGGVTPVTKTVGASGGVLGILVAFSLLYGDREIMLFPIPLQIKAKYFVMGVAFITVIGAINAATPGHGESVAYFAHFGGLLFGFLYIKTMPRRGFMYGASETYFGWRNSYYRWKRRRAARKFEVYMRDRNREVKFDDQGKYVPPEEDKKNGGGKSGWVN